ncbi:MAG: sugar ABC transporter ATP-binding protein, partial [Firmicutes bacterium]|nr:sugar ABC transporter ATP-binding protein [Bacillota bacterium]
MAPKPLCFQMNHISKRYPGVQALDDVTFSVKAGEVHALVGQNGAGKSTLVKILSGVVQADSGEIILEGRDVTISSPREAQAQGVGIVHQEFSQAPHMTVAENIFLGRELARDEGLLRLVRFDEMERKVQACLKELGVSIAPGATVGSLSVSEQQIVEIAKVVSFEAKIVIMDEPTAALSQQEIARLFAIIRRLKSNGVSVVYISHRLDEVFEIADTVTVLKDGKKVVTLNVADTDVETLITLMVGYEPKESAYETISSKKNPFLELRDISDGRMLKGVDLVVYEGEILGIFGAVGAGKSELARAIFGANECEGSIEMYGQEINPRCPIDAIELGIGYLPEDRKNHGLNLGLPVLHNVTLPSLSKVTRFGIVNA